MTNKPNFPKFVTVLVLNDGETYSNVRGCSICIVPYDQYNEVVESGGDAKDFEPVMEIGLDSIAN